jgi:O-methyltransferase
MRKYFKKNIEKLLNKYGYDLIPLKHKFSKFAVELDEFDVEIINDVLNKKYTMTSIPRLINTLKACRYVVENGISGDFVECGVWRGGNGILAKSIFERLGSDKKVWMFDTFAGMTQPTLYDVKATTQVHAEAKFKKNQKANHNEWCYASLEDVKKNCLESGIDLHDVNFIEGDICNTLINEENIPQQISVLRLDTDWYESTKIELETLYPQLSRNGVLIIDDYGSWEGARRAVDEYFESKNYKPLFNVTDFTGRSAIKGD